MRVYIVATSFVTTVFIVLAFLIGFNNFVLKNIRPELISIGLLMTIPLFFSGIVTVFNTILVLVVSSIKNKLYCFELILCCILSILAFIAFVVCMMNSQFV